MIVKPEDWYRAFWSIWMGVALVGVFVVQVAAILVAVWVLRRWGWVPSA